MALPISSGSNSSVVIEHRFVEGHLNKLPQVVQDVFRQKIRELNLVVNLYCFQVDREVEYFHELGRKETKIVHRMGPEKENDPDRGSPLYTEVRLETLVEPIPVVLPGQEPAPANQISICSALLQFIGKICDWFRDFFARFCCPARAG